MASGNTIAKWLAEQYSIPSSNHAVLDRRNTHWMLRFDTTTQKTAFFRDIMARNYAGGGITAYAHVATSSATTGTMGLDITIERIGDAVQDVDSDGFATAQTITAVTVPATSGNIDIINVAITAGSTGTDSIAAGEMFRIRVRRDVANDNAAGDVELYALELKET